MSQQTTGSKYPLMQLGNGKTESQSRPHTTLPCSILNRLEFVSLRY